MAIQIQFRRGTAAEWTSANPILAEGEMGNETDTGKFKVGDGVRTWTALPYSSGPVGPQGPIGLTGPQGIQGIQGIQGEQGETGPQGVTGDTGAQGIQGIQGEVGPQGDQGEVGPQGPQGDQGIQGIQGIQGEVGPQGDQGIQGIQGIQGEVGPQGDQGIQGIKGDTGDQGIQGIQGPIGLTGDTGPQGIQGIQGEVGPQGPIGLTGDTGPQGIQGIQGIQGETGEGVIAGGAAGQILAKASATDFDTTWIDNVVPQVKHIVKNSTGSVIPAGSVVYVSGASGTNMLVSLADADSEATSSKTMGLTESSIAVNGTGYVVTEGLLAGLNTNAATAGQSVWLSSTAGGFVFGAPPAKPAHSVYLGVVTRVQTNNGEIFVKVQNGYELEELHNVSITDPQDKQVIKYDGVSQLWINGVAAGGVTQSATPPADPNKGDGWLDENTGKLYVWWVDANSSQWVQINSGTVADGALTGRVTAVEARATTLEGIRPVSIGGTGASSFTAGTYLKGNNGSAIVAQSGIPAGDITSGTLGDARLPAGTVLQVKTVRYAGRPVFGFSSDTIISYLNVAITPKRSNSMLVVQYQISGEATYNAVFRAYRDGGLIYTSGYQGYNEEDGNQWSGIAVWPYDTDIASTPNTQFVQYFVPSGSTAATTMQIAIRSSASESPSFYMNRSVGSNGTTAYEIMVSSAIVWEIAQ